MPLVQLLGARRDAVPVYGSGGFTSYSDSELAAELEGWLRDGIRMVKSDVAIVTCAFEVAGVKSPDGKSMPPMKGTYTTVMTKTKGKWFVVSGRPMIPVPPSPAPAHPMK